MANAYDPQEYCPQFVSAPSESAPPESAPSEAPESTKWQDAEIRSLLDLYKLYRADFLDPKKKKKAIWQKIADKIVEKHGGSKTADQVNVKYRFLKMKYTNTNDFNRKQTGGGPPKTCPFWEELNEIHGLQPFANPLSTCSNRRGFELQQQPVPTTINKENSAPVTPGGVTPSPGTSQAVAAVCSEADAEVTASTPKRRRVAAVLKKKAKVPPSAKVLEEFRNFQEQLRSDREKQMEKAEEMHREKMKLMRGFLKVFKQFAGTNSDSDSD